MAIHIVGKNNPECPLCKKKFERKTLKGTSREFYTCKPCNIAIDVKDPMVGRWFEDFDPDGDQTTKIPCPKCNGPMRMFCRSDEYMKASCPRCHCEVETNEMPDGVYITKKGEGDKIVDS